MTMVRAGVRETATVRERERDVERHRGSTVREKRGWAGAGGRDLALLIYIASSHTNMHVHMHMHMHMHMHIPPSSHKTTRSRLPPSLRAIGKNVKRG